MSKRVEEKYFPEMSEKAKFVWFAVWIFAAIAITSAGLIIGSFGMFLCGLMFACIVQFLYVDNGISSW